MSGGGPRTTSGKAITRRNALRHGVLSTLPVVPGLVDWRIEISGVVTAPRTKSKSSELSAEAKAILRTAVTGDGAIMHVRWLGGEEVFAGDVVSEDDKPIQHTKSQDAVWFTLTIIGAPILVLTLGLVGTWARRRKSGKKVEVTP